MRVRETVSPFYLSPQAIRLVEFEPFPKMARWSRDVFITEKLDGTNAAVVVAEQEGHLDPAALWQKDGIAVYAQSRTRFVSPKDDNYGWAAWVVEHAEELAAGLGIGRHFGEWWGKGIQRNYAQPVKRFSLFNVARWSEARPDCCDVVPTLYMGVMVPGQMEQCMRLLEKEGSFAAPGFMDPEGLVLFHVAANMGFKKTLKKDDQPKSLAEAA